MGHRDPRSVEKYAKVQEAFEQTIDVPTVDVDLAAEEVGEAELRRLIASVDPRVIHCIGSQSFIAAVRVGTQPHSGVAG